MHLITRFITIALGIFTIVGASSCAEPAAASVPTCPVYHMYKPPTNVPKHMCLSSQERTLGETVVHDPTVPDSILLQHGISLTIRPSDYSSLTKSQAITIAEDSHPIGSSNKVVAHSAVLAELHNGYGQPGELDWIVDISQPGVENYPAPGNLGSTPTATLNPEAYISKYQLAIINARTGKYEFTVIL